MELFTDNGWQSLRALAIDSGCQVQPSLPMTSMETLSKVLHISVPKFPNNKVGIVLTLTFFVNINICKVCRIGKCVQFLLLLLRGSSIKHVKQQIKNRQSWKQTCELFQLQIKQLTTFSNQSINPDAFMKNLVEHRRGSSHTELKEKEPRIYQERTFSQHPISQFPLILE